MHVRIQSLVQKHVNVGVLDIFDIVFASGRMAKVHRTALLHGKGGSQGSFAQIKLTKFLE